jgi:hypothetical protein
VRRACLPILLCSIGLAVVGTTTAAAQTGSVSLTLVGAGTADHGDPRAPLYVIDHVHPGDRLVRRIRLGNTSSAPVSVRLSPAAASVGGGTFHALDDAATNELTRWTTTSPRVVRVPAGRTRQATVTIAVPAGTGAGERYGVVWAAVSATSSTGAVVNRVGLRIYLSVGAGPAPSTAFVVRTVAAGRDAKRRPYLDLTVANTGGRAAELTGGVVLDDAPGDLPATRVSVRGSTLAPGATRHLTAPLPRDLEDGPWRATVTLRANGATAVARARVVLPGVPGALGRPQDAVAVATGRSAVPAVAAGLLLLLVTVGLLDRVVRLRRRAG